jgi:hypothetical protein
LRTQHEQSVGSRSAPDTQVVTQLPWHNSVPSGQAQAVPLQT